MLFLKVLDFCSRVCLLLFVADQAKKQVGCKHQTRPECTLMVASIFRHCHGREVQVFDHPAVPQESFIAASFAWDGLLKK